MLLLVLVICDLASPQVDVPAWAYLTLVGVWIVWTLIQSAIS